MESENRVRISLACLRSVLEWRVEMGRITERALGVIMEEARE